MSNDSAADFLSSLIGPKETACYAAGEMISPYVLREKLGDGGFGIVWLAEQSQPIRRRARRLCPRMQRSRRIQGSLRHLDSPTLRTPETARWREKMAASLAETKAGS